MKKSKSSKTRNDSPNSLDIEIAVSTLLSSGDFVVLRKIDLARDHRFSGKSVPGSRIALCLDTETTGLDHAQDRIIELGIVAFEYDPETGAIIRIIGRYSGFEDPGVPLAEEIIQITGITDEMVAGQAFDDGQVEEMAKKASLVIAHNAAFDRKFVEARFPIFMNIPWACTVSQVNWQAERISSRTLEYLLYKCGGYCINAHRALDDTEGLLGLLLGRLPVSDTPIFKALLTASAEVSAKIYAVGAPFDKKDALKQRGYRWNDGSRGGTKGWWISVPFDQEADELAYLAAEIYPGGNTGSVEINRIDAYSRFSVRDV
ncbi:MAG: DNA polymerase III subunit epsilon [Geobacter sp.]|nr:MAG: DNA polymerase III subunit epsilon [Geobacter sp.]